jgi:hypothetical protein
MAEIEDAHLDVVSTMIASLLLHQYATVTIALPLSVEHHACPGDSRFRLVVKT